MIKPIWIVKAAINILALGSLIAPLDAAWSQTTPKSDNPRPAVAAAKPSQASQLKSGVRPGGAPGTAVAAKLDGAIATNPTAPKRPTRQPEAHTDVPTKP